MTTTAKSPRLTLLPEIPSMDPVAASAEEVVAPRTERLAPSAGKRTRRLAIIALAALLCVIGLLAAWAGWPRRSTPNHPSLEYFTVQPRTLCISVTERGALESQKNAEVLCEVDDVPDDAVWGTTVLWIIENGSLVKAGDLVVELDATPLRERLDREMLEVIKARAQFIARTVDYANRQSYSETIEADARLAVEMAKVRLRQFEDEQGGTFQIALQEIELSIQQRDGERQIEDRNLLGTEQLHELGYKSKGDLAQARLQAMRATTALEREAARKRKLVEYDYVRSKLQLQGDVESAERALLQVERNNKAALAQNKAWLKMAEMGKYWHELRYDRFQAQAEKCRIYAPQGGMVAYYVESNGWGSSSVVKEGVAVHYRQPILSIPDLHHMHVSTAVHESVVNRVKEGMRATIHIDAFPDRLYEGTVDSMDVLPDPGTWLSSDTKTYKAIVTIDGEVEQLKPGMTAVVEIHIDHLADVLCIPVQAIVRRDEETWCYVAAGGRLRRRAIELGQLNDTFAQVRGGLQEGDRVVLDPTALIENAELEVPEPPDPAHASKTTESTTATAAGDS